MAEIAEPPTHTMHELDASGDTTLSWDPANKDEVEKARAHFNGMKEKGYSPYRTTTVAKDVKTGDALTEFDPAAERIIFVPPVRGGYPTAPTANA